MLKVVRQRLSQHERPLALADALQSVPRSQPFAEVADLAALPRVPTVIVGDNDDADPDHPLTLARAYADVIPGARFETEPPGHSPLAWQGASSRGSSSRCAVMPAAERYLIPQCIGCGSMRAEETCDVCDYERLEVVPAEGLDRALATYEHAAVARVGLREALADLLTQTEGLEPAEALVRAAAAARTALAAVPAARDADMSAGDEDAADPEPTTIWRCRRCGSVDSMQECLGICIWKRFEWVRADASRAAAVSARQASGRERQLRTLMRQLAFSRPRGGYERQHWQALRAAIARELSDSALDPDDDARVQLLDPEPAERHRRGRAVRQALRPAAGDGRA